MTFFEQSRYFFNNVLPNIILSNLEQINIFLSQYWWLFFSFLVFILFFNMLLFRKNMILKLELRRFDDYYKELSKKDNAKEVEYVMLESAKLLKSKFGALYELRGETYILVETNTATVKNLTAPMRIGKKNLNSFKKSGNYLVYFFASSSENYVLLLYPSHPIKKDRYIGYFQIILGYYEKIRENQKSKGAQALSNVSQDTSMSLVKLQMDKYQFFKFFIALIINLTKAEGAKLLTKKGEMVFEYKPSKNSILQKEFYIRNTPYKLEFYDNKPLSIEKITQIGAFLDMSGAFLENIDQKSEMIKNYLDLLHYANEAIELENPYYKHHSEIVQTVAVELAKSLFLAENEMDNISLAASLHDIGMVGDLLSVLNKDKLQDTDIDLIREHPIIGSIIVEPISHIYPISDIIKYHHERFDGKGYPFGLKESKIPIGAQAVGLGEFYAGITGDRSYKKGKTHEEAVKEISKLKNKMFSSVLVDIFLESEQSIKTKIIKIKTSNRNSK